MLCELAQKLMRLGHEPQARLLWQSRARVCVEHAIAGSKHRRPLQHWLGRREDLPETVPVIGWLVSGRAAAW
jgi:hypothetical protein